MLTAKDSLNKILDLIDLPMPELDNFREEIKLLERAVELYDKVQEVEDRR